MTLNNLPANIEVDIRQAIDLLDNSALRIGDLLTPLIESGEVSWDDAAPVATGLGSAVMHANLVLESFGKARVPNPLGDWETWVQTGEVPDA